MDKNELCQDKECLKSGQVKCLQFPNTGIDYKSRFLTKGLILGSVLTVVIILISIGIFISGQENIKLQMRNCLGKENIVSAVCNTLIIGRP